MKPTKVESVQIKMTLDKAAHTRHARAVHDFAPNITEVRDGDTLKLTYNFYCSYFGDIVKKLNAVRDICSDPKVVMEASCDELTEGRILVYEALKKLDEVIQLTAARTDDPFPWRRYREDDPKPEPKRRTWLQWWRGE